MINRSESAKLSLKKEQGRSYPSLQKKDRIGGKDGQLFPGDIDNLFMLFSSSLFCPRLSLFSGVYRRPTALRITENGDADCDCLFFYRQIAVLVAGFSLLCAMESACGD